MKLKIDRIIRDFLALRGESPDLLPVLGEGEDSAVLTIAEELRVRLLPAAVKAVLTTPLFDIAEVCEAPAVPARDSFGSLSVALPDDFLRLHTLQMSDWREPLHCVEPEGTLRSLLGANAPAWMACSERPLVLLRRDDSGPSLRIFGTNSDTIVRLLYVAKPLLTDATLTLPSASYPILLNLLCDQSTNS